MIHKARRFLYSAQPRWVLVLGLSLVGGSLLGGDWTEYRGPNNDGKSAEKVSIKWASDGPKRVWKSSTSAGFSSFVVGGGKAFTLVTATVDGVAREACTAVNATSGETVWTTPIAVSNYQKGGDDGAKNNNGGDGPRSTPTLDGKKVYVYSADMVLSCLDAATGKILWSHDIIKEFAGQNISWKNATSPVIDGDFVYVAGGGVGQSLLAFKKSDGALAWKTGEEKLTHASPTPATIHGVRQVVFFTQSGLVSVEAKSGKSLWKYPFRFNVSTAASPVVAGETVYCAAGYGVGSAAVKISKKGSEFEAAEMWRQTGNKPVANHWSTPVYHDGHLYGMFSFKEYADGPLKCVELATGKVKWEQAGFGAGNVILANGKLLALSDSGTLVAVEATPVGYKELARAQVISGKCWSTPALSNGRVYVRSTKEGVCVDLSGSVASR